jgi:hypothetical protein
MTDLAKSLTEALWESPEEVREVMKKIRKNHEDLESCIRHDFDVVLLDGPIRREYRCRICGGIVNHAAYQWYTRGRVHGGS